MSTAIINAGTYASRVGCVSCTVRCSTASLVYTGILLFVAAVSVYDGYLVIRTGDMIRDFEQNPVGLYLLNCNDGNPAVFLFAKGLGTLLVLAALAVIYRVRRHIAFPVASAILLFQSGLLIFLERN